MTVALDHLVVAARTLEEGVAWCRDALGIDPGPGGRHPAMGTHNRLFPIGGDGFERAYFEILAIDPDAKAPERARWFGMDSVNVDKEPRLIHWVARTSDIHGQLELLRAAGFDPGRVITASRETTQGLLQWQIAVRDDGEMMVGGVVPTLIEWGTTHPAASMPPVGVALRSLTLEGVPAAAVRALGLPSSWIGAEGMAPSLQVALSTPRGMVTLRS